MTNSNSYGVTTKPTDAEFGLYDPENGEWTGTWFVSREEAQAYVRENGPDDDGWYVVSTADGAEDDII